MKAVLTNRWKQAGALRNPKAIRFIWKSPTWVQMVVLCLSASLMGMRQNPENKSIFEKCLLPVSWSRHVVMFGSAYRSGSVHAFNGR